MVSSRYLAQELFDGLGREGQKKLGAGRALLVGCGALGSINAEILARAGIGFMRIADSDQVELANLHRQFLFTEEDADVFQLKVHAAKEYLEKINSEVEIEIYDSRFNLKNGEELAEDVDLIIDCSDNPEARNHIDQVARELGIPWIYGGVVAAIGMVKFVAADKGESIGSWFDFDSGSELFSPCQDGILNTTPMMVATLQSTEAIKYLSGNRDLIKKDIIYFDLWKQEFDRIEIAD